MTRERSIFQVWFAEEFSDDWQKVGGRLWSREAADLRVRRLRADRPTRYYRITESCSVITTNVVWLSTGEGKSA